MNQIARWILLFFLFGMIAVISPDVFVPMVQAQEESEGQEEEGEEEEEEEDEEDEGGEDDEAAGPPTEEQQQAGEEEAYLGDEEDEECSPLDLEEYKLFEALKARAEALKKREILLEEKEVVLRVIEEKMEEKFKSLAGKLEQLERRLEIGVAEKEAQEKRFLRLVSAITTLSPRKAAPILEKADQRFSTRLLLKVTPERVGKLLAMMPPDKAARLMLRLERAKSSEQKAAARARKDWNENEGK